MIENLTIKGFRGIEALEVPAAAGSTWWWGAMARARHAPDDSLLLMQMKSAGGTVSLETLAHDEARALRDDLGFDLRRVA